MGRKKIEPTGRVRIVVVDVEKCHAFHVRQHVDARHRGRPETVRSAAMAHAALDLPKPAVGQVHCEMEVACPDGKPNCRHCGDPAYAESCAAAGHCPYCGTRHGVAPESVLAAHGFGLEPV